MTYKNHNKRQLQRVLLYLGLYILCVQHCNRSTARGKSCNCMTIPHGMQIANIELLPCSDYTKIRGIITESRQIRIFCILLERLVEYFN